MVIQFNFKTAQRPINIFSESVTGNDSIYYVIVPILSYISHSLLIRCLENDEAIYHSIPFFYLSNKSWLSIPFILYISISVAYSFLICTQRIMVVHKLGILFRYNDMHSLLLNHIVYLPLASLHSLIAFHLSSFI
eukprot:NODE_32_length_32166_cov_0.707737.p16 type:complete len:135 gc:universal NODE_32_length_32166_cov_0.707737:4193-4597(+)